MKLYRYFLDSLPHYLARHYWWAYLWRPAVWFFDHQPIINLILFFQYEKLMNATMTRLKKAPKGQVLQLTCVYGSLTSNILKNIAPRCLHLADVSQVQLNQTKKKIVDQNKLLATRMNAETLSYKDNAFSTLILFFLLHEMPTEARYRTLSEVLRVLSVDGMFLCTEYAPLPSQHWLYRFPLTRYILTKLEPFLASFWQDDLLKVLNELGKPLNKKVEMVSQTLIFSKFYRVTEFRVIAAK